MYDKTKVLQQAQQLANRLSNVRPAILDSSLYGGSNQGQQQQDLHRAASELVHGINSGWERQVITEQVGKIEGHLQGAAATGLVAQGDLQQYLGMIDNIYASLDQEN